MEETSGSAEAEDELSLVESLWLLEVAFKGLDDAVATSLDA